MSAPVNKVYLPLLGRPVLCWTLNALADSRAFEGVVLVHAQGEHEQAQAACAALDIPVRLIEGGERRQDSVLYGLRALPKDCDIVAIQDGARPFPGTQLIHTCIQSARENGSGVAACAAHDTIKVVDEQERVVQTPARERLRAVKTPQTFRLAPLLAAYEQAHKDGFEATDDAQMFEHAGHTVHLVPCAQDNIKITSPEDMRIAQALLGAVQAIPRVGTGYDVHRLVPGRDLILCGVKIPYELGLDGHSDADVALHALTDALLGACGMGDIGRHFPDTDAQYKNADSAVLLQRALKVMRDAGFVPVQADVTIIAQKPKLAAHMPAMTQRTAQILGIDASYVNVKATTTEHLGFTGRGEGIAAQAVASVLKIK